ncbi:hypothetical protein [Pseudoalteromonas sp. GB56]
MNKRMVALALFGIALGLLYYLKKEEPSSSEKELQTVALAPVQMNVQSEAEQYRLAQRNKLTEPAAVLEPPQIQEPLPIREPDYLPPITKREATASGYQYQGDLDDHQAYLQFQHQQQADVKQAYIAAAKVKVSELKDLLARGEREGISHEQLQFARDKIAAIEKMSEQLQTQIEAQTIAM